MMGEKRIKAAQRKLAAQREQTLLAKMSPVMATLAAAGFYRCLDASMIDHEGIEAGWAQMKRAA